MRELGLLLLLAVVGEGASVTEGREWEDSLSRGSCNTVCVCEGEDSAHCPRLTNMFCLCFRVLFLLAPPILTLPHLSQWEPGHCSSRPQPHDHQPEAGGQQHQVSRQHGDVQQVSGGMKTEDTSEAEINLKIVCP